MPTGDGSYRLTTKAMKELGEIKRRVLGHNGAMGAQPGGSGASGQWYWAKNTSAITAGTFESPTTFTFNVWLPNPADTDETPALIVSTDDVLLGVTGSNYMSVDAPIGTRLKMEFQFGTWNLKIADCP